MSLDMNKGVTHHGVSVNHCQDVKYKISINVKQKDSYLACNTVEKVEQLDADISKPLVQTSCQDCGHSLLALIDGQIKELIKLKLNEQIMDNLHWHITQLLSNKHFSGPVSLNENFN